MIECCHIDCDKPAEFRLTALRRTATGPAIAGPDIYSDETYACEVHVGSLLGYQPDARDPQAIYWEVAALLSEVPDQPLTEKRP